MPPAVAAWARRRAQYIGFYSSADFWLTNRADILHDQLEIATRNVTNAPRVDCCDSGGAERPRLRRGQPRLGSRTPRHRDPRTGRARAASRSRSMTGSAARPRPTDWPSGCSTTASSSSGRQGLRLDGKTIAKRWYVVEMDQFMRGFAYTALAAGQDISDRITTLYAPPGAWSHGQLWGADTIEVPASATFAPKPSR